MMSDTTRNNEQQILRLTVKALLGINGTVDLCYEDDLVAALEVTADTDWQTILNEAFACESCTLWVNGSFVYFIWGNGDEGLTCICNYTVSLGETLEPVFDWIDVKKMGRG